MLYVAVRPHELIAEPSAVRPSVIPRSFLDILSQCLLANILQTSPCVANSAENENDNAIRRPAKCVVHADIAG
jgi:hypothetical protein